MGVDINAANREALKRLCRARVIVGAKSFGDAIATTRRMAEICVGTNPTFPIGLLDGEGTPTAIDIRKVVETGITPVMNTAIAHRDMGAARMVGAGISTAPLAPF